MKKILIVVSFVALLGIIGCGGSATSSSSPYFPLASGNKWSYKTTGKTETYMNDSLISETDISKTTEYEITQKTTLSNGTDVWEQKSVTTVDTTTTEAYSYIYVGDSIEVYFNKDDSTAATKIPKDPKQGDKWFYTINDSTKTVYEVVGTEDVTVEEGSYTGCLKIKVSTEINGTAQEGIEQYLYWAKNVGQVKTTYNATMEYGTVKTVTEQTTELTGKELK